MWELKNQNKQHWHPAGDCLLIVLLLMHMGAVAFGQSASDALGPTDPSSLGTLVVLVGDEADSRSFDFEIQTPAKGNDWDFFTDINKFKLMNSDGVVIACNPVEPEAGIPYFRCDPKTAVLGADFEIKNAKNLKPGVYTGTKSFEIVITDDAGTKTNPDSQSLTLTVIKQGRFFQGGRIVSMGLTGIEAKPRLGSQLLCEFTVLGFEPDQTTVLPMIDFSLDWNKTNGGPGTTLLSARVPFDSAGGSAARMLKMDQENTLPVDAESPNNAKSPLRTLFNSRTSMETGFPLSWTDPIVRSVSNSRIEKIHYDSDEQSDLKALHEHVFTVQVICPPLDVLGAVSATGQLRDGHSMTMPPVTLEPAIGVFPLMALEGERVRIVVASGSGDLPDQARVGDEFVSLTKVDDQRVEGWLTAKYGSFDVTVPKLPQLEKMNLLVPVNVLPVANPRYLMFGTKAAAIWEFDTLRRFVQPEGYTAYPTRGWTTTVEPAFTFKSLNTGTLTSLEIDPVGVLLPQSFQGVGTHGIHRLLKSELMPDSVLVAEVTDPADSQLTGIESTSIALKFGHQDLQPSFGDLPVARQFEIPVRLSFTAANGQSYDRIAYLQAQLTIENGAKYDWYAGAILAAFVTVVVGFFAMRRWVNKPLKPRPLTSGLQTHSGGDGFDTSGSASGSGRDQWSSRQSPTSVDTGSSSGFGSDDSTALSGNPFDAS